MAEESTAVGAEAARAALEASASITGGALSVSLKIDSPIVAGVALATGAAVTLGAFYLRYRWKTENANQFVVDSLMKLFHRISKNPILHLTIQSFSEYFYSETRNITVSLNFNF